MLNTSHHSCNLSLKLYKNAASVCWEFSPVMHIVTSAFGSHHFIPPCKTKASKVKRPLLSSPRTFLSPTLPGIYQCFWSTVATSSWEQHLCHQLENFLKTQGHMKGIVCPPFICSSQWPFLTTGQKSLRLPRSLSERHHGISTKYSSWDCSWPYRTHLLVAPSQLDGSLDFICCKVPKEHFSNLGLFIVLSLRSW